MKWYRFSTDRANGSDPGENTEAVGDADAVYSTGMGMRNLHRVMDNADSGGHNRRQTNLTHDSANFTDACWASGRSKWVTSR